MAKAFMDTVRHVYPESNKPTYHFTVGPDGDGLGLVEINYKEDNRTIRMVATPSEARLLSKALDAAASEAEVRK